MNNQNNHNQNPLEEAAVDLLNRSIDGGISSSEQEELDRLLDPVALTKGGIHS